MPLIKNFKSTTILNAFILNSIAAALTIFVAMVTKENLDKYVIEKDGNLKRKTTFLGAVFTILLTFTVSMITFGLMYFVFGYGGGMKVNA